MIRIHSLWPSMMPWSVGAHGGFDGGAVAIAFDHDVGGAPEVEVG